MHQTAGLCARALWLPTLRRYLAVILLGNLAWEAAHLRL